MPGEVGLSGKCPMLIDSWLVLSPIIILTEPNRCNYHCNWAKQMRTHLIDFYKIAANAITRPADKQMMRLAHFLTESFAHEHLYLGLLVNYQLLTRDCLNLILLSQSFKSTYNNCKEIFLLLYKPNPIWPYSYRLTESIFFWPLGCLSRSSWSKLFVCQEVVNLVISVIAQMAPRAPWHRLLWAQRHLAAFAGTSHTATKLKPLKTFLPIWNHSSVQATVLQYPPAELWSV